MQVDPIKPTLKAPGAVPLKPKCDELLLNFAFNFNLRRYSPGNYPSHCKFSLRTWVEPGKFKPINRADYLAMEREEGDGVSQGFGAGAGAGGGPRRNGPFGNNAAAAGRGYTRPRFGST